MKNNSYQARIIRAACTIMEGQEAGYQAHAAHLAHCALVWSRSIVAIREQAKARGIELRWLHAPVAEYLTHYGIAPKHGVSTHAPH